MSRKSSRRTFLKETTAIGIGLWAGGGVLAKESVSANERVRFACIGIAGKGDSDSADAKKFGDVVAICDIDDASLEGVLKEKFAGAQKFNDYRKMLDEIGKNIDAVTVSTPDHHHVFASIMAMKMGKACFCQKPLTHSVSEARLMADVAREMRVATQMGNQGTAQDSLRRAAQIIKEGKTLGTIKEVHVWTNRPIWPQGAARPKPADSIPESVHWDLWVGPAPFREYAPGYHPFKWRGWWDFGTGALGDMACHTFNMPFMALDLKNPTSIEAEHSGHNRDSYPNWSIIKFMFPSTGSRPAIPVTWYDGGEKPERELFGERFADADKELPKSGALVVGDKDTLYAHGDYCEKFTLNSGAEPPTVEFVKSPGHFQEWVNAIKGGPAPMSNFPNYAGPLTETILLGNLAVWAGKGPTSDGKKLEWDARNLRALNAPEVEPIIKRPYRSGWVL